MCSLCYKEIDTFTYFMLSCLFYEIKMKALLVLNML